MVELMFAVVILAVAVCGLSSSILSSMVLDRVNRETTVAQQAAREMLERIHGEEFREVFHAFDAVAGNYGGLDVEQGPGFAVPGLDARVGDPDGLVGRVEFPTLDVGGVQELREDVADADLGMPRDLDGNGLIDAVDVSATYVLLPVRVVIEWRGVRGDRQLTLESVLSSR